MPPAENNLPGQNPEGYGARGVQPGYYFQEDSAQHSESGTGSAATPQRAQQPEHGATQPAPGVDAQFAPQPGVVQVNIQGSVMTSNMITPSLLLDGMPMQSRYGANQLLVMPGWHRIELYAQWMRRYGQAYIDLDVAPGSFTEIYYAAPAHQFTTGNIGYTKQPRKGMWMMWLIFGFLAFVIAFMLVVLFSLNY